MERPWSSNRINTLLPGSYRMLQHIIGGKEMWSDYHFLSISKWIACWITYFGKMELPTALDQELLTAGSLNLKPLIAQLKKKENRVTTMLV
jgi:hypothetical protein